MKGTPLSEMETKNLEWLETALQRSIGDPEKRAYAAKNAKDLDAIRAELASRP